MAHFQRNIEIRLILVFDDLYWHLNIDFSEKNDRNTFVRISDQLPKVLIGFSLRRLGAEIAAEGGGV